MRSANLDPDRNLWYEVFDFNDEAKTAGNWTILPKEKEDEPWFPLGQCEPVIPRTEPGSVNKQPDDNMQTFSIHTGMEAAACAVEATEVALSEQNSANSDDIADAVQQLSQLADATSHHDEIPTSPSSSGRSTPELFVHYVQQTSDQLVQQAVGDSGYIMHGRATAITTTLPGRKPKRVFDPPSEHGEQQREDGGGGNDEQDSEAGDFELRQAEQDILFAEYSSVFQEFLQTEDMARLTTWAEPRVPGAHGQLPLHIAADDMELICAHREAERPQTSYARARPRSAPPMRPGTQPARTNSPQLSPDCVFDIVKAAVRQADMYHVLQVALGFAEGPEQYDVRTEFVNLVTPGTKWINLKDLKDAFLAARVQFTDAQVAVLATHIAEHVSTLVAAVGSEQVRESQSTLPQQLYRNGRLWATAVRIYLVSARRAWLKRPKAWDSWWTEKKAHDMLKKRSKKVELKKALAGQDHELTPEELDKLLEKYQIVPADLLEREIENRLRLWRPDDGTTHKRQRAKLREQEHTNAGITKDLVQLFEQERRINKANKQQFKQKTFLDWLRHRVTRMENTVQAKKATRERLLQRAAMEKEAKELEEARAKAIARAKRLAGQRRSSGIQQRLRDTECDDEEKQRRLREWELTKIREKREARKKLAEQRKQEQEAKKRRLLQAKREYKAWVKMRKKNKYFSTVAEKVYKIQNPDTSVTTNRSADEGAKAKKARSKLIREPKVCWVDVPEYDRATHPKDWQPIVPKPDVYP